MSLNKLDIEIANEIDIIIQEARRSELTYTQKEVAGKVDRVIVQLEGRQSEAFTKLAKNFKRTKTHIERLEKVMESLNKEVKDKAIDLFNAEDEIATRVVDTVSIGITISKLPEVKDVVKTDWERIAKELASLTPELDAKLKELTKKFTTVKAGIQKGVSLRVDLKEGKISDIFDKLKNMFKSFLESVKSWGDSYDSKLDKIKKGLN
jgi:hypothetical protein